jgi:hypothetical protein
MAGVISIIILNQQKGFLKKCKFILCQQVALSKLHKDCIKNLEMCSAHIYPMKSSIVFPSPLHFLWP